MIHHAGLIATYMAGAWRGVLIEGVSGCGKSDLALRMLDHGFRLVADDRVLAWNCEGVLFGRAPDALANLIEVRGLGICAEPALRFCRIVLAARCEPVERLPDPAFNEYAGLSIPLISIAPLEASAPAKLRRALQHLGRGAEGAYLGDLAAGVSPRPGGDSR
ncbi:MAG: HPr kinase/phosphorylase [Pseudomonadota bacterium]|uniref:HPr kinase/phosphorylase n=1 Tax=Phenylobacterium sp. TaxID=1871053 RepID=UPI0025F008B7|nr:HPr kinase/phosphorylase [Phenylobacterium sp.]MBT9470965.1 HPr kinase/phosphorylase [Phenylobacterium sp.]